MLHAYALSCVFFFSFTYKSHFHPQDCPHPLQGGGRYSKWCTLKETFIKATTAGKAWYRFAKGPIAIVLLILFCAGTAFFSSPSMRYELGSIVLDNLNNVFWQDVFCFAPDKIITIPATKDVPVRYSASV